MPVIQQIDDTILNFIQSHFHIPFLDSIMLTISFLGNGAAVWIVIAVLLLSFKKYRSIGFLILAALLLCFLLGDVLLKPLIARARPFTVHPAMALLIPPPTDFSFPSGHTDSSFAASTVILLQKKSWGIVAILLAMLISFSRLYLYVHYPSDILGGALLGIAAAFAVTWLFKKYKGPLLNSSHKED